MGVRVGLGKRRLLSCLALALPLGLAAASAAHADPDGSGDHVVLKLRWVPQYQFAGYYVALEKGYYREAGLDVEIQPNGPGGRNPVESVLAGEGDFGITGSGVVAERMAGKPLVVLAAVFQHSPNVWAVRADSLTRNLHDLVGKRLMLLMPYTESLELMAPFMAEGIPLQSLHLLQTSFDIQSLVRGETDAFNAYVTNEPFVLQQAGVPYRLISPETYGIDFYGDVLFSTERTLKEQPRRVKAFTAASLKGWRYAMDHVDEVVQFLHRKYATDKSIEHLLFEAEKMHALIMPDIVEIGHQNPGRWKQIADTYVKFGLAKPGYDLGGFLYDPDPPVDASRYTRIIAVVGGLGVLIGLAAFRLSVLNIRLRRENEARLKAEADLSRIAREDALTGLPNRRQFLEIAGLELERQDRFAKPCSLLMMDIDHFKQVNDTYGQQTGDKVLKAVSRVLQELIRSPDTAARFGGEEFAVLLPETDLGGAATLAERVRSKIESTIILLPDGRPLKVTASLGAGALAPGERVLEPVLSRADVALHQARDEGRNRVRTTTTPIPKPG